MAVVANLIGFDGDLYGRTLKVELIAYLRPEASFSSLEALIAQIGLDASKAREVLGIAPRSIGIAETKS